MAEIKVSVATVVRPPAIVTITMSEDAALRLWMASYSCEAGANPDQRLHHQLRKELGNFGISVPKETSSKYDDLLRDIRSNGWRI